MRGVALTDASALTGPDFTKLISGVQNNPGAELKLQGTVDGQPTGVKRENENGRLRVRTEMRDGNRGSRSDNDGRGRSRPERVERPDRSGRH